MARPAYLPPSSAAYIALEVWGETIAGRIEKVEIIRERRASAARRVERVLPHVYHSKYGYGRDDVTSAAPYTGRSLKKTYAPVNDPDVRCFAYLQVELALVSLDDPDQTKPQIYRQWALARFAHDIKRISGGQKREREVVKTIRHQLAEVKPETIADSITRDVIRRLNGVEKKGRNLLELAS